MAASATTQDRIQSWLVDIPDMLLPLDSSCHVDGVVRADSPVLGFELGSFDKFPSIESRTAQHIRDLSLEKPLPARPPRTPSPPTPTLTSGTSSLTSSPYSEVSYDLLSHSRGSSRSSAIWTPGMSDPRLSTYVSAGHESLSRTNSTSSSTNASGLSALAPPPTRRPSQARRSISSRSLRPASPSAPGLTAVSSFDNLRNANRASVRNAVYIDGEEIHRRLTRLVDLSRLSGTAGSIPEDDSTESIQVFPSSTSSDPPSTPNDSDSSSAGMSTSANAVRTRSRGDSLTPEFTFPRASSSPDSAHSTTPTPTATTPLPPPTTPSSTPLPQFHDFLDVDSDSEQNAVELTPTKKRQSRRQRLVSFISKLKPSSSSPSGPYSPELPSPTRNDSAIMIALPASATPTPWKHISTPSSSTASSYDYLNATLSPSHSNSRPRSIEKLSPGFEDADPFAKVPVEIVVPPPSRAPSMFVTPSPPSPPPVPVKKRMRAVSLTSGTTFGTSKAAKAAHQHAPLADLPVLDISRQNLTPSPRPSTGLSFSLPVTTASSPLTPSAPSSAELTPTPSNFSSSRFTQKIKSPFSSKQQSPPSPSRLTSPSTPNLKKPPLHKRFSLNPILLPRGSSSSNSPNTPPVPML